MIDIIKSINADQEINIKEIYELFKTESPDFIFTPLLIYNSYYANGYNNIPNNYLNPMYTTQ